MIRMIKICKYLLLLFVLIVLIVSFLFWLKPGANYAKTERSANYAKSIITFAKESSANGKSPEQILKEIQYALREKMRLANP